MSLTGVIGSAARRRGSGEPDLAFSIRVKTDNTGSSGSNQFTLPITTGTYDYNVDWGDGTNDNYATSSNQTHTYSSAGTYDLRITGTFPRIFFAGTGDRLKILKVLNWGSVGFSATQTAAFSGCSNLSELAGDASWTDSVTTAGEMFDACSSLTTLPTSMTFSSVQYGFRMFRSCTSITSLPSGMVLGALTNGNSMFAGCTALTSLPSGMVLGALTDGSSMFTSSTSLTSLPSSLTLASLQNGFRMFRFSNFTDLPAGITLSALTSGGSMFGTSSAFPTARYSQLLIDIESLNPNNGVTLTAGISKFNAAGQTAKNALIARGWSISDGGLES
jgi:hypothetical protein